MMNPFEGGKALDGRTLEDECESGEIYGETLVGNIHDPCNLEMTSVLNQMKW